MPFMCSLMLYLITCLSLFKTEPLNYEVGIYIYLPGLEDCEIRVSYKGVSGMWGDVELFQVNYTYSLHRFTWEYFHLPSKNMKIEKKIQYAPQHHT